MMPRPTRPTLAALALLAAAFVPTLAAPLHAQGQLAFVSNEGSRDISVVDLAAGRVVATIPVGERPRGIQASPDGRRVFVALSDDRPNEQGGGDAPRSAAPTRSRCSTRARAA